MERVRRQSDRTLADGWPAPPGLNASAPVALSAAMSDGINDGATFWTCHSHRLLVHK